jgi:hypothetical protein
MKAGDPLPYPDGENVVVARANKDSEPIMELF